LVNFWIVQYVPKGIFIHDTVTTDHQVVKEILYGFDKNRETSWELIDQQLYLLNAKKFFTNFSEHIQEEETLLFPTLRSLVPANILAQLPIQIQMAKEKAPARLQPSSIGEKASQSLDAPGAVSSLS
jgi:hemerythrin-like domain-containing protein